MNVIIGALLFVGGLVVGSFLNVVIDRLPEGQSLIHPSSHCPSCKKKLEIIDLIPLVSYAWLGGKCRYCGAKIPARLPIVEAFTGVAFGLLYLKLGLNSELAVAFLYFSLLIVIAVIDLERHIILPIIMIPAIIISIIFSILLSGSSFVPGVKYMLIGGVIGFGVMLLIYALAYWIYRGENAFGFGDVYLGTLMGVMLGYPNIIVAILLAVYIGGIFAIITVLIKAKKLKSIIAFGPILVLGTMLALIWGTPIWHGYLTLFKLS